MTGKIGREIMAVLAVLVATYALVAALAPPSWSTEGAA